jgi:hypothetical protein
LRLGGFKRGTPVSGALSLLLRVELNRGDRDSTLQRSPSSEFIWTREWISCSLRKRRLTGSPMAKPAERDPNLVLLLSTGYPIATALTLYADWASFWIPLSPAAVRPVMRELEKRDAVGVFAARDDQPGSAAPPTLWSL